jgi:putative ABC transport system permease protein
LRDGDGWWLENRVQEDPSVSAQIWAVDEDYLPTLGMQLKTGRNFDKTRDTDSNAMIINEAMAKALNISDDALGQRIKSNPNSDFSFSVVGVVKDFNFDLLTEKVAPVAMRFSTNAFMTAIKVNSQEMTSTLTEIEAAWKTVAPNQPFVYEFMDQRFAMMYANVERIRNILTAFAILAVCIACLGLFGLSIFMVEQKHKEISVRLVLGAKVSQIMGMLSFNFIKPILIALIIATPLTWLIMREWLSDFVYKVTMTPGLFLISGLATLLIALATVSFESFKAAFSSPVNGLRND